MRYATEKRGIREITTYECSTTCLNVSDGIALIPSRIKAPLI